MHPWVSVKEGTIKESQSHAKKIFYLRILNQFMIIRKWLKDNPRVLYHKRIIISNINELSSRVTYYDIQTYESTYESSAMQTHRYCPPLLFYTEIMNLFHPFFYFCICFQPQIYFQVRYTAVPSNIYTEKKFSWKIVSLYNYKTFVINYVTVTFSHFY